MTTPKYVATSRTSFHGFKNIEEELRLLKPSPELFNYYLSRINALIKNHDLMLDQIDRLKKSSEAELTYKREFLIRNEEVSDLRRALSDMQLYLQKEREQILSLSAENDILRVQLFKYHKKVDKLLKIAELKGDDTGHPFLYFDGDSISSLHVKKKPISECPNYLKNKSTSATSGYHKNKNSYTKLERRTQELDSEDNEARLLEIGALIDHRDEQISLLNDEIITLNQDRELKQNEGEVEIKQLQKQVCVLTERLHETETKLIEATHQATKVGKELISKEVFWMKERNEVSDCLERFYGLLQNIPLEYLSSRSLKSTSRDTDISTAMEQLTLRDNLMNWYHGQCRNLEDQLKEESSERMEMEKSYKIKIEKLLKYVEYLQGKLKEENQRRRFDMEGLLSSVKILCDRIVRIEKKVNKKTLCR